MYSITACPHPVLSCLSSSSLLLDSPPNMSYFSVYFPKPVPVRCGVYPNWILYSTLIDAGNFVEMFPAYYIFNGLLGTLQLLHILWTFFLFKAIHKALAKGGVDDKRSDSEPSDDDEEEDENDNEVKKDL